MFINKIKKEGVQEYIYNELKNKRKIDFENIKKVGALEYSQTLARRLNYMK